MESNDGSTGTHRNCVEHMKNLKKGRKKRGGRFRMDPWINLAYCISRFPVLAQGGVLHTIGTCRLVQMVQTRTCVQQRPRDAIKINNIRIMILFKSPRVFRWNTLHYEGTNVSRTKCCCERKSWSTHVSINQASRKQFLFLINKNTFQQCSLLQKA